MLLFSSATLAQESREFTLNTEQFQSFVQDNVSRGLAANMIIYRGYLYKTYKYGHPIERVTAAMHFAQCSIMWRNILEVIPETENLTHDMLRTTIWRALEEARIFVEIAGGDGDRLESVMVPKLDELSDFPISDTNIYECTALDLAVFTIFSQGGVATEPPEDWILEPIPEYTPDVPESEEDEGTAS